MRVLYIGHSGQLAGAERCYLETSLALKQQGVEVVGLLPCRGPLLDRLAQAGIPCHVHWYPWWISRRKFGVRKRLRLIYQCVTGAIRMVSYMRRVNPDVVITNSIAAPPIGSLAAGVLRRPHVWYVHEFGREDHATDFVLGERLSCGIMSLLSSVVLVNSRAVERKFKKLMSGRKIRLVRYAVEIDSRDAAAGRPGGRGSERPLHVVLLGRYDPGKGQEEAIEALRIATGRGCDVRAALVGGGSDDYSVRLRSLVDRYRLGARVAMVEFSPDPLRYLAEADVALMCSRNEAFGRVTLEAMKMGVPVIGSNTGATPEIVKPGVNGWLYRACDPSELAERIIWCHAHREETRRMGEQAREWAQTEFTLAAHAKAVMGILSDLPLINARARNGIRGVARRQTVRRGRGGWRRPSFALIGPGRQP